MDKGEVVELEDHLKHVLVCRFEWARDRAISFLKGQSLILNASFTSVGKRKTTLISKAPSYSLRILFQGSVGVPEGL